MNNPGDTSCGFQGILPKMPDKHPQDTQSDELCCGPPPAPPSGSHEKPGYRIMNFVDGFIHTVKGPVPKIKPTLDIRDFIQTGIVRTGYKRNNYKVSPGLYAMGNPDRESVVLATANFKLTFDRLRKELGGINAWILVLDTRGINVWCAAGKGTFSTGELVRRIATTSLETVVNHKKVIVPQLGATGISAGEVKKRSGFRVIYGPIRASDIPLFLKNNQNAAKDMRLVTFTMYERFILTPVEIQIVLKHLLITAIVLFVISGIGPGIFSFSRAWERGIISIIALLAGVLSGAVITPVLLPYIPFKEFAAKGILAGSVVIMLSILFMPLAIAGFTGFTAVILFSVAISSYLAMNFSGTTPFTSPSGVEKEMKRFIPVQLGGVLLSGFLWIYSAF